MFVFLLFIFYLWFCVLHLVPKLDLSLLLLLLFEIILILVTTFLLLHTFKFIGVSFESEFRTTSFISLLFTCTNHLSLFFYHLFYYRCYLTLSNGVIPNLISSSLTTYPTQHPHLHYHFSSQRTIL